MNTDTIKVLFTYAIATIIVLGGFVFLGVVRNDPPQSQSSSIVPLVAGFIGAALQFVFNRETQTQTARATERATAAGAASQGVSPPSVVTGPAPQTGVNP